MESSVDREQLSMQQRCMRLDTAALCDDVENALGDVLCDGLDEIEEVLVAEDTVMQSPEEIRDSVDRLTRELRKHAEDNCKVFKSYSLHHMFRVSPEMAERLRQRETGLPATGHGAHTAEEEAAVDAELAELQERAHAATATLGVLQQEQSALEQQVEHGTKRLEWLQSLSSSASAMAEDVKAVAKHADEVGAASTSIQDDLAKMGRECPTAGKDGLPAVVAQFEKDRATTTTASRDDILQLGAANVGQ